MTDELDDLTAEERAEAEAFARALEGDLDPSAPSDALDVAGLLRTVAVAPKLDDRLDAVRARVLGAPGPNVPPVPASRPVRGWTLAGAVVALSSAAALLLFVPMSASPPATVVSAPTAVATSTTPTNPQRDTPTDGTATTTTSAETPPVVTPPSAVAPAPVDERGARDAAELAAIVRGLLRSETPPLDAVVEVSSRIRDARFAAMLAAHRGAP